MDIYDGSEKHASFFLFGSITVSRTRIEIGYESPLSSGFLLTIVEMSSMCCKDIVPQIPVE